MESLEENARRAALLRGSWIGAVWVANDPDMAVLRRSLIGERGIHTQLYSFWPHAAQAQRPFP
jgi:hypothetical protein